MKISIIVVVFCLLVLNQAKPSNAELKVINIGASMIQQAIKDNKHLLVHFYSSDCGFCKLLNPVFEKAAQSLHKWHNQSNIFAQTEAVSSDALIQQFGLDGFPKVKYFNNGKVEDYLGNRNHQDLLNFALRKIGKFVTEIENQEDFDSFIQLNEVVGVLFDSELLKDHYTTLNTIATAFPHVIFVRVTNSSVQVKEMGSSDANFRLYKQLDNEILDHRQSLTYTQIFNFLTANSHPNVIKFNDKAIERIFHQGNAGIFLLVNESEESAKVEKIFREAASKLKERIIFCIARKEEDLFLFSKLSDYFGPEDGLIPVIFISKSIGHFKYLFENDFTVEQIELFVTAFENRELQRYHKSEQPPTNNDDELVKTIVGKTFDDLVVQSDKNYCVTFYQSTCSHCQRFLPIFSEVAQQYKNVPDLSFGTIEITKNEVPQVQLPGYPTVYLYLKGDKQKPIQFISEKTKENLVKFVQMYVFDSQNMSDL